MKKRVIPDAIDKIILHCSDSQVGDVKMITEWHKERGFDTIGYNYVILKDGTVEEGRELEYIPAHCKGQNTMSIGICLIGVDSFTRKQFESLSSLIKQLRNRFTITTIVGHNYYNPYKTCPNFDVNWFLKEYIWGK